MSRPLTLMRPVQCKCPQEFRLLRKHGYALLDSQNLYIPMKQSITITPTEKKNETNLTYFYTF